MFRPPPVIGAWRTVHRPLHHAVEGLPVLAGPVALPPVRFVERDLIVKVVVDGDVGASLLVDSEHVLVEGGPVAIVVVIAIGDKEVSVDHLVQECLDKVLSRPQFQQWHGEPDRAETAAPLVTAQPRADSHSWRPLDLRHGKYQAAVFNHRAR